MSFHLYKLNKLYKLCLGYKTSENSRLASGLRYLAYHMFLLNEKQAGNERLQQSPKSVFFILPASA